MFHVFSRILPFLLFSFSLKNRKIQVVNRKTLPAIQLDVYIWVTHSYLVLLWNNWKGTKLKRIPKTKIWRSGSLISKRIAAGNGLQISNWQNLPWGLLWCMPVTSSQWDGKRPQCFSNIDKGHYKIRKVEWSWPSI